ncbi:MAG: Wzz/FepE/Etk N-terminal domain-containing protein [Clostridia bacterium]|nr:Wzz/FepE/Etk N-terminal domain-containing protein [Clostridia bacterium]
MAPKTNIELSETINDMSPMVSPHIDNHNLYNEEDTIDLYALFLELLDHIWPIVGVTLLMAFIAEAISFFLIAPKYESTAKLYVVSASSDSVVNLTDLNIGSSLTADYEELLTSYPVVNSVLEEMNLEYTREELLKMTKISNPQNTRILDITITSKDPKEARDIANKFASVAIRYLPETMSTNAPNIAQKAILPEKKVGPSNSKNTIIGAVLGFVIICGFYTVRFLLDDTFHTSEDIENYLGIVPLAVIPEAAGMGDDDNKKKTFPLGKLIARGRKR